MQSFMQFGLLDLPWWGYVIITLVMTHMTVASVTIFLHRHQAHHALQLHPIVSHCFRFWLWLTTGTITKEWVAIHRKHHAKCETLQDSHSPQIYGIETISVQNRKTLPIGFIVWGCRCNGFRSSLLAFSTALATTGAIAISHRMTPLPISSCVTFRSGVRCITRTFKEIDLF